MINPTLILNQTFAPPEGGKVYGIHSATRGFLDAYIAHARPDELHIRVGDAQEEVAAAEAVRLHGRSIQLAKSKFGNDIRACAFFYNIPQTNQFWLRQQSSQALYSICGINHSLTGEGAYTHLRDIFLAPTEAWDAIICTSVASRAVIARYFEGWSDYLGARGRSVSLRPPLQLPVIPLGVDMGDLKVDDNARERGVALRQRLSIPDNALVALFLGRLNFSSKAHPYPMFLALEEARARLDRDIHLIQAGWYPSQAIEDATVGLAGRLAPSVHLHHVGAVTGAERVAVLAAADLFLSLSDNIQETFGLTLVEAMACGLPVVATDWDGYRDTVEHGQTGFLVPTVMAPAGSGAEVGLAHGISGRPYNRYLMDVSQATAIDLGAVRDAVVALGSDPGLRSRMGKAGRRRAETLFDWGVVIRAYQALWTELDARRRAGTPLHGRADPLHPDPFWLFESFASDRITQDTTLVLAQDWRGRVATAFPSPTMRAPSDLLLPDPVFETLIRALLDRGPMAFGALAELVGGSRERAVRGLVWLIKAGIVEQGA